MKRNHRKLLNKSGKEKCEICNEQTFLEQHHIRGRKIPNANCEYNLANICANCHKKVHRGVVIIEDRLMTTNGPELIWHYNKDCGLTGNDATPYVF